MRVSSWILAVLDLGVPRRLWDEVQDRLPLGLSLSSMRLKDELLPSTFRRGQPHGDRGSTRNGGHHGIMSDYVNHKIGNFTRASSRFPLHMQTYADICRHMQT